MHTGPFTIIRGYGWDVEAGTMEFINLGLSQTHENQIHLRNACIDGLKAEGVVPTSGMMCLSVEHEQQDTGKCVHMVICALSVPG